MTKLIKLYISTTKTIWRVTKYKQWHRTPGNQVEGGSCVNPQLTKTFMLSKKYITLFFSNSGSEKTSMALVSLLVLMAAWELSSLQLSRLYVIHSFGLLLRFYTSEYLGFNFVRFWVFHWVVAVTSTSFCQWGIS